MNIIVTESQYSLLFENSQNPRDPKTYPNCIQTLLMNPRIAKIVESPSKKEVFVQIIGGQFKELYKGYQFYNNQRVLYPDKRIGNYYCKGVFGIKVDGKDLEREYRIKGTVDEWLEKKLRDLRKEYPIAFDLGVWVFLGPIGRIVVTLNSSIEGYQKVIKASETKDNKLMTEGIVEMITGPVALGMTTRYLGLLGMPKGGRNLRDILITINKSGLPLLISEGVESFYKWGFKTYGVNFEPVIRLLNNENNLLTNLLKELPKK